MSKEGSYKPTTVDYKHFDEGFTPNTKEIAPMNYKDFKSKLAEKHLTPAELKKREEVAKAMEREHPGMDKAKKMAIATATAKKVAEDAEQVGNQLQEGKDAQKRFEEYHGQTAKLLKGITKALSDSYTRNHKDAHWGHVGDIRHYHDQLRDIHDRLHEQGEYAKQAEHKPTTGY